MSIVGFLFISTRTNIVLTVQKNAARYMIFFVLLFKCLAFKREKATGEC